MGGMLFEICSKISNHREWADKQAESPELKGKENVKIQFKKTLI